MSLIPNETSQPRQVLQSYIAYPTGNFKPRPLPHPPVGVSISVVVTEEVVLSVLLVPGDLQRLVHRREEVLTQRRNLGEGGGLEVCEGGGGRVAGV